MPFVYIALKKKKPVYYAEKMTIMDIELVCNVKNGSLYLYLSYLFFKFPILSKKLKL